MTPLLQLEHELITRSYPVRSKDSNSLGMKVEVLVHLVERPFLHWVVIDVVVLNRLASASVVHHVKIVASGYKRDVFHHAFRSAVLHQPVMTMATFISFPLSV
jgi:hypothetical protein